MKLTKHQRSIIRYIGDKEVSKKDIVTKYRHWYYHNASFHIGNVLSRMVNSDKLIRVRKGYYKNLTEPKKSQNQLDLF